ncbi:MAG: helix-turn-helix transcriptional regulator [Pirellulaceae bacterium]
MTQRGNDLIRGSLDLMVLSVLADGPKYGYLIQQRLNDASGGAVRAPAGSLYPLLHRLESEKLLRSRVENSTGRQRKWYELTAAGRRRLSKQAQQWNELAACLETLLRPVLEAPPDPA